MKALFTNKQVKWLENNVNYRRFRDLTNEFNALFGTRYNTNQIKFACLKRGLKNGLLNYRPVGSERVDANGLTLVKVSDVPRRWEYKHKILWEKLNGSVPHGQNVIFADGNKGNFAIDNLMLVSNAELMVMNCKGYIFDDAELTKAGYAVAKVTVKIHEKIRRYIED